MYDSLNDRVTSSDTDAAARASSPAPESGAVPAAAATANDTPEVVEEVVIEEVSIDGMCGVY